MKGILVLFITLSIAVMFYIFADDIHITGIQSMQNTSAAGQIIP